jgi:hypothetical protein
LVVILVAAFAEAHEARDLEYAEAITPNDGDEHTLHVHSLLHSQGCSPRVIPDPKADPPATLTGGDSEEKWEEIIRERREERLEAVMDDIGCWDKLKRMCCCCCKWATQKREILTVYNKAAKEEAARVAPHSRYRGPTTA